MGLALRFNILRNFANLIRDGVVRLWIFPVSQLRVSNRSVSAPRFERRRAAIGKRVDVIDMESRLLSGLRKPAVFATSARALKNRAFQRGVHAASGCGRDVRSFSRESISARSTNPSASRRSAAVSGNP
jgi:hypothetical protein